MIKVSLSTSSSKETRKSRSPDGGCLSQSQCKYQQFWCKRPQTQHSKQSRERCRNPSTRYCNNKPTDPLLTVPRIRWQSTEQPSCPRRRSLSRAVSPLVVVHYRCQPRKQPHTTTGARTISTTLNCASRLLHCSVTRKLKPSAIVVVRYQVEGQPLSSIPNIGTIKRQQFSLQIAHCKAFGMQPSMSSVVIEKAFMKISFYSDHTETFEVTLQIYQKQSAIARRKDQSHIPFSHSAHNSRI